MKGTYRLWFGPLAAALLTLGVAVLALQVPGYSHVRQTVSEIGEAGSPMQIPFTVLLCLVAVCLLVFALAVREASVRFGHSAVAAYLVAAMAVSGAGVGVFSHPHPLHNVFGMSELVGYQAPLALALNWRRDSQARAVVRFSWIMFCLLWVTILLNLSGLDRGGVIWAHLKPWGGIVQRSLFATWFAWCAGTGLLLLKVARRSAEPAAKGGHEGARAGVTQS